MSRGDGAQFRYSPQWNDLIAGGVAGLTSRFFIAPLDVIKIQLQVRTHTSSSAVAGWRTAAVVREIWQYYGLKGFWRGNIPAEILYVSYGAAQFVTYRHAAVALQSVPLPSTAQTFVAGALAGLVATGITFPLDTLRTRFAAQGNTSLYKNIPSAIKDMISLEQSRGFYRGFGAGLAQIIPYMGLFFCIYEPLHLRIDQINTPLGSGDAIAGVLASIVAKTGCFPLDTVRKRLQVQGPHRAKFGDGQIPSYDKGIVHTARAIISIEGVRGLYRGLSLGLIKAAPTSAITMWTYERVMHILQKA